MGQARDIQERQARRLLEEAKEEFEALGTVVYHERPLYLAKVQVKVQMAQVHATLAVSLA